MGVFQMTAIECDFCGKFIEPSEEGVGIVRVVKYGTVECKVKDEIVWAIFHRDCWNKIVCLKDNILDRLEVI
jgi:hypothetical protein